MNTATFLQYKSLSDFLASEQETEALAAYMQKVAVNNRKPQKTFLNIQDYFSVTRANHTEKSNVLYLTVMAMLHDLHKKNIEEIGQQWLVVEGDAKVYEIFKALKLEYGNELKWVIPYQGDWYVFKKKTTTSCLL